MLWLNKCCFGRAFSTFLLCVLLTAVIFDDKALLIRTEVKYADAALLTEKRVFLELPEEKLNKNEQ